MNVNRFIHPMEVGMKIKMLVMGAAMMTLPGAAMATEHPLEFKTIKPGEVMSFPGGSGISAQALSRKPVEIRKEPAAASTRPLYGEFISTSRRMHFRIDESAGTGKGYDRLVLDLNTNRDLTDDAVIRLVVETNKSRVLSPSMKMFGPITAPAEFNVGGHQLEYFAQLYVYSLSEGSEAQIPVQGQLRLKTGWYMETTAEIDGAKRRVALVDANCNYRLGDSLVPSTYRRSGQENTTNWFFQNGDMVLVDLDNSGRYQDSPIRSEMLPYYPMAYLGSTPSKISISTGIRSLVIEPWTEPMAELDIQPHGDQVDQVQVAVENAPGAWQLMMAKVTKGKTRVPPGPCRLYACTILGKTPSGDTLFLGGNKSEIGEAIQCPAGVTTPFKCGAPLKATVSSERNRHVTVSETGDVPSEMNTEYYIRASLVGAGGETYSRFLTASAKGTGQPSKPTFLVTDSQGGKVESGTMEYG
jgi:hypothetical protein